MGEIRTCMYIYTYMFVLVRVGGGIIVSWDRIGELVRFVSYVLGSAGRGLYICRGF